MPDAKTCRVEVITVASNQRFVNSFSVAAREPLHSLAEKWANVYSVPVAAVGFEDVADDRLVNLRRSPRDLGWGPAMSLRCVPVDVRWGREGEEPDQSSRGAGGGASGRPAKAAAGRKRPSGSAVPKAQQRKAKVLKRPASSAALAAGRRASGRKKASGTIRRPAASVALLKRPASRILKRPASAGRLKSRILKRPASRRPVSGLSKRPASATAPGRPGDDDRVKYEKSNPKKEGSASYARYQKYKRAKTVAEALRLGSTRVDLIFDSRKGFLRRG